MWRQVTAIDDPAMDIVSFLPPVLTFLVVPVAIGATINVLNRNQDDDASPTLFSPLVNANSRPTGPIVREVDLEPFHFDRQGALGGTIDPGRPASALGRRASSPTPA